MPNDVRIVNEEHSSPDVVTKESQTSLRVTGEVVIQNPGIPIGADQILITDYDNIATQVDNVYVITSGKTMYIQGLLGSAEWNNVGGAVVELWYDPNGTGVGMSLIAAGHCNGNTFSYPLADAYLGDGTKAIRMRRITLGGGSLWIFGRIFGYEI